jgi:hypothetical protein
MVIWLTVAFVLAAIVFACCMHMRSNRSVWDESTYRAAVGLRAVRRRLEVAHVKGEIRRDAAMLRRELRDELGRTEERTSS